MASCPTSFHALAAMYEPCYCDLCNGAEKLLGEPCALCAEPRWGCRSLQCFCEVVPPRTPSPTSSVPCVLCGESLKTHCNSPCADCGEPLWGCRTEKCICVTVSEYRRACRPYFAAQTIQSVWRGYKTRKTLQHKNAEEVLRYTPIWRSYDDQYRMYVFCQTLMAELKKDDPTWDATQEPYYIWMMEHGPVLEEWETFLRRRGWVRPKKQGHLNTSVFKRLIQGVLQSSGVPQSHWKTTLALYNTFMKTR